jgi:hypothetical protein
VVIKRANINPADVVAVHVEEANPGQLNGPLAGLVVTRGAEGPGSPGRLS